MDAISISRRLGRAVDKLSFEPPVAHVYNPLRYAREPHEEFLRRFAKSGVQALLLGMNPGPFGMAQTGVPFGEIELVRTWLKIEGKVKKPRSEHEQRPIQGFDCTRSEVSGRRLWGWAKERFGTPQRFFGKFFVWNYCPLMFLEEGGRNRTPDKLPARERDALFEICDEALVRLVEHIDPRYVIGVGKFAEARALKVLRNESRTIGMILHPSPASPSANRGWAPQAEKQLAQLGIQV